MIIRGLFWQLDWRAFCGFSSVLIFSIGLYACGESKTVESKDVDRALFLKDITSNPDARKLFQKMFDAKKITSENLGNTGMVAKLHSDGVNINSAKTFYQICSGRVPYTTANFTANDFRKLLSETNLSTSQKARLDLLIQGAFADDYYCGSKMQLSFPLENAADALADSNNDMCLDRLSSFQNKADKYEAAFFSYVELNPDKLVGSTSIKDVIVEALEDSHLCDGD